MPGSPYIYLISLIRDKALSGPAVINTHLRIGTLAIDIYIYFPHLQLFPAISINSCLTQPIRFNSSFNLAFNVLRPLIEPTMCQKSHTIENSALAPMIRLVNRGKSSSGTVHWTCPFCKVKAFTSWEALNRHTTNCWPKAWTETSFQALALRSNFCITIRRSQESCTRLLSAKINFSR